MQDECDEGCEVEGDNPSGTHPTEMREAGSSSQSRNTPSLSYWPCCRVSIRGSNVCFIPRWCNGLRYKTSFGRKVRLNKNAIPRHIFR